MLAAAPSVYKRSMDGGDKVPYFASYKLLGPKLPLGRKREKVSEIKEKLSPDKCHLWYIIATG